MQECLGCSLVDCHRNRFLPSLHDSVRAFSLGLAFVWYAKRSFIHACKGQLVRYFSRTTHSLFLVLCAYMLVYAHVSMCSADAMPCHDILCYAAAAFAHLFERDVLDATSVCKLLARIHSWAL